MRTLVVSTIEYLQCRTVRNSNMFVQLISIEVIPSKTSADCFI